LTSIVETGVRLAKDTIGRNETFAVRARRAWPHPFSSKDIEEKLGEAILKELKERRVKVNLRNPDKTIYVEVREKKAFLSDCISKGYGGLPISSQGKVIALLSGGVDSAVAAWLMMKRGALPILLYFNNSPYWTEIHHQRVLSVAKFLRELVPVADYRLIIVPHGEILKKFIEQGPRKLSCILCKRSMYRIACELAKRMDAKAIVTGESLGQVASQTLVNLSVLNEASSLPVLRPLVGMNKDEIIMLSSKIGIKKIAAVKVPRCKAVPRRPTTRANLEHVKAVEKVVNVMELTREAIKERKEILL
jgi:thiamine biosynthesis protein ThiI